MVLRAKIRSGGLLSNPTHSLLGESEPQVFPFRLHLSAGRNRGMADKMRVKRKEKNLWSTVFNVLSMLNCLSQESLAGIILKVYNSFFSLYWWDADYKGQTSPKPPRLPPTSVPLLSQRENFFLKMKR